MLPKKSEVGRKPGDVERSKEIVRELEKMKKVDCKSMDPVEKRRFSIKKEALAGELFQLCRGVRYAILDECLNDLKQVGKFLEVSEDIKEEREYYDHANVNGAVSERCRHFFITKTNRVQLAKLRDLLTGFRQMILHDSSSWSLDAFDEEKKKVSAEIASLDLSEMSEEKLRKEDFEMLQYQLHTKNQEI